MSDSSEEYNFNESASNYSSSEIESEIESKKTKIINHVDHLYGPLEVQSSFNYFVKSIEIGDTTEIEKYSENDNGINFEEYYNNSIFTRIIRVNMNYIKPIIGLLYVTNDLNSYFIIYLSVHSNFRRQGLAKMMLSSLAEFIKNDRQYNKVQLLVNINNKEAMKLYTSIGFKITEEEDNDFVYMSQTVDNFIKITNPLSI